MRHFLRTTEAKVLAGVAAIAMTVTGGLTQANVDLGLAGDPPVVNVSVIAGEETDFTNLNVDPVTNGLETTSTMAGTSTTAASGTSPRGPESANPFNPTTTNGSRTTTTAPGSTSTTSGTVTPGFPAPTWNPPARPTTTASIPFCDIHPDAPVICPTTSSTSGTTTSTTSGTTSTSSTTATTASTTTSTTAATTTSTTAATTTSTTAATTSSSTSTTAATTTSTTAPTTSTTAAP